MPRRAARESEKEEAKDMNANQSEKIGVQRELRGRGAAPGRVIGSAGADTGERVALVTGGAGGIGSAVCRALAADGWRVAVHCHRSRERAEALAAELGGAVFAADLATPGEAEALVDRVRKALGPVSLLVNNAGISEYGLLTDLTDARWEALVGLDLSAVVSCCRAVIPDMVHAKRGCIVNVGSIWGEVGASCEAAYSAVKAGVVGLSKALAKELGPSGIRVNVVSPGCIETGMLGRFTPEELDALREETPLCRLGRPEDVAACVRFLASEEAGFVTGQVLGVNGGFGI